MRVQQSICSMLSAMCLLFFLLISTHAVAAPPPLKNLDKPKLYKSVQILCVGVNHKTLQFAEKDAVDAASLFTKVFGYNVETLVGKNATKKKILERLQHYRDNLGENDAFLFFFAGHGQTLKKDSHGRVGFLLPHDADIAERNINNLQVWKAKAVEMTEIAEITTAMKARHVLLLVDACYSGFMGRRSGIFDGRKDLEKLLDFKSRLVITAGTEGQSALEDPEIKHGLFTAALLHELSKKEPMSATEVFVSVRERVANMSKGAMLPQRREMEFSEGEFVFLPKEQTKGQRTIALEILKKNWKRRELRSTKWSQLYEALAIPDPRFSSVPEDQDIAWKEKLDRFKENASVGEVLAMAGAHLCYAKGLGVRPDPQAAYRWAQQAYETRHPLGEYLIGRCYLFGLGVTENELAAEQAFEKSAEKKLALSSFRLGQWALQGKPTDRQIQRAMKLMKKAREESKDPFPLADCEYGKLLITFGRKEEKTEGQKLIATAAKNGLARAKLAMYQFSVASAKALSNKDRQLVTQGLMDAANVGLMEAQWTLAYEYYQKKDLAEIVGLKKKLQCILDLPQDFRKARLWGNLAATQDHTYANRMLALMYASGDGVVRNLTRVREYYERAARKNRISPENLNFYTRLIRIFTANQSGLLHNPSALDPKLNRDKPRIRFILSNQGKVIPLMKAPDYNQLFNKSIYLGEVQDGTHILPIENKSQLVNPFTPDGKRKKTQGIVRWTKVRLLEGDFLGRTAWVRQHYIEKR